MVIETGFGKIIIENEHSLISEIDQETCPHCGQANCCYQCDLSVADFDADTKDSDGDDHDHQTEDENSVARRIHANGFIDGVESILLALSPFLKEIPSDKLNEAVTTAFDGCDNMG